MFHIPSASLILAALVAAEESAEIKPLLDVIGFAFLRFVDMFHTTVAGYLFVDMLG